MGEERERASSGDVLKALAQEALQAGVHPDRESVLRSYVGEDEEPTDDRSPEGQGAGGEGSKPQREEDRTDRGDPGKGDRTGKEPGKPVAGDETSPTTTPESSSDRPKGKAGK